MRISHDVFDVADRLKAIDGGYYPVYNLSKHRYEIHHENMRPTLCVVLPYPCLDVRAIYRLYETMVDDVDKYINELDKHNEKLDKMKEKSTLDESRYKARHLVKYLDTTKTRVCPDYKEI